MNSFTANAAAAREFNSYVWQINTAWKTMKLFDRVSERDDRQWMLKRAFTPSIAATQRAPVSGNVDVEEFFYFHAKGAT